MTSMVFLLFLTYAGVRFPDKVNDRNKDYIRIFSCFGKNLTSKSFQFLIDFMPAL